MGRRKIVGVNAVAPGTEAPKEEKKEEIKIDQKVKEDFLEVLYYQTKQRDGLLGEFALDGTYSIKNEKILESLVSLPKVLQEKTDNIVYATTKVGKYFLNFKVELDISESYCSAKLFIIEIEHKLDESIKHIQQLAEEVEIYSPLFTENIFKLWNIVRTPVELDKREFVVSYLELQERNELFMKELSDILAQLYLIRMLETLQGCGEIGEKVFYEYKMMIEKLSKNNPGFLLDNIQLKAILDGVILKNKALDVVMTKGGAEIMKTYVDPINKLRGKEAETTIDNVEVTVKKQEGKSAPSSSPKGKSDNKGGKPSGKSDGKPKNNKGDKNKKDKKPETKKPQLSSDVVQPKSEISNAEKERIIAEAKKENGVPQLKEFSNDIDKEKEDSDLTEKKSLNNIDIIGRLKEEYEDDKGVIVVNDEDIKEDIDNETSFTNTKIKQEESNKNFNKEKENERIK